MTAEARLLALAKPQGRCMFHPTHAHARHRLWDAIDCSLRMDGWSAQKVADNYGVTVQEVLDVREAYARARRLHRPLPGRLASD